MQKSIFNRTPIQLAVIITASAFISSCSSAGFSIGGELRNAEGAKVVLSSMNFMGEEVLDSAVVADGKFALKGSIEEPSLCRLFVFPNAGGDLAAEKKMSEALYADFYLENASVTFSADALTLQKYYWAPGRKVEAPVVEGSEQQKLKEELDEVRKTIIDSLSLVGGRISEEYYGDGHGDTALGAELASAEMKLMDEYYATTIDFVKAHPAATVSFDEVSYLFSEGGVCRFTAEQIDEFVSVLRPHWASSEKFTALEEVAVAASKLAIGQKFVDAEFTDLDGNKVMLSSVIPEGRIVMLEFWASWCGPCRGEIPHLRQVRAQYPQFDIISISLDDKESDWKKAVAEEKMSWTQLRDSGFSGGNAMNLYGVMGIPCCIILDEQGCFLKTNMRGPWLDAFLASYYAE